MKRHSQILTLAAVLLLAGTLSSTQESGSEKVTVPFSHPGKPGKIEVSNQRGSITIKGYNGQEVIVEAKIREKKLEEGEEEIKEAIQEEMKEKLEAQSEKQRDTSGLKKIALPGSMGLAIEEENNKMEIRTSVMRQAVDLEIQIPFTTSLELSSMMGGAIAVDNVKGELEVSNLNGSIKLTSISGTVLAHSLNGDIEASFVEVNPDKPMSFSTMNGDIDVTLPASTKANLKMKTDYGDVYSDFEIQIGTTPQKAVEEPKREGGRYRIAFDKYYLGSINGGGPEYLLKTFHGDILIRKGK
ncbi:MAG: DUF4097 family beta strand repeat-containing protein [Candidatus Aminicenantes bacterium]|jgi:hypothetical protein